MREKIILPVSGLEVELAIMSWKESKDFFQEAAKFMGTGKNSDDWMERVLARHYPKKILSKAMEAAPDAMALYNDTVRYNRMGPEAIKNSSRSGTGAPTQTETSTAAAAGEPTQTD